MADDLYFSSNDDGSIELNDEAAETVLLPTLIVGYITASDISFIIEEKDDAAIRPIDIACHDFISWCYRHG